MISNTQAKYWRNLAGGTTPFVFYQTDAQKQAHMHACTHTHTNRRTSHNMYPTIVVLDNQCIITNNTINTKTKLNRSGHVMHIWKLNKAVMLCNCPDMLEMHKLGEHVLSDKLTLHNFYQSKTANSWNIALSTWSRKRDDSRMSKYWGTKKKYVLQNDWSRKECFWNKLFQS